MKQIEEKINTKTYPSIGVARAVVKRAGLSKAKAARLLELIDEKYVEKPQPDDGINDVDVTIVQPPFNPKFEFPPTAFNPPPDKLDQQLLVVAFHLLGLCIEHRLSREEMYSRLEKRLMAGMG